MKRAWRIAPAAGPVAAAAATGSGFKGFGTVTSYRAADPGSQELAGWFPGLRSADGEYLPERDEIVARIRDIARNSGWASGAVTRLVDSVVGADLRLSAKPDYRALGLSIDWATEFAEEVEAAWRLWSNDPDRRADATRHDTLGGLFRLAYRHYKADGDALAVALWLPERGGTIGTAIQVIDPDRLSNPEGRPDSDRLKGGIELDEHGAPTAYWIRRRHPADHGMAVDPRAAWAWERVGRETGWGRARVIHWYDRTRAGQTRGVGSLTPVLERLKMIDHYDRVELQAAVLNAVLAAFIESPFDGEMVEGMLRGDGEVSAYQRERSAYHHERALTMNGVRIPHLFPGERLSFHSAARPTSNFADFEAACLRNIAAGIGLSYEQLSMDWSKSNYSSARAALLEVWRGFAADRQGFAQGFATPIYALFLEELIATGRIRLPRRAPSFWEAKGAYTRAKWIGPGRGWVDPTKEAQAALMRMDAGISTLEDECAEQGGDWQEKLEQQAYERRRRAELGLPDPTWAIIQEKNPKDRGKSDGDSEERE